MRIFFLLITLVVIVTETDAQRDNRYLGFALTNQHTAYPFQRFGKLFTEEFHPGFQVSYGLNWKTGKRHDWHQQFAAGYFYHRLVQHGIPLYSTLGYRYKFTSRWQASADLGAGYLHSLPDMDVYKLNDAGEYEEAKGIGRGQVMVQFGLGPEYKFSMKGKQMTAFLNYHQILQAPFINSYVPLLPYNGIAIGVRSSIKSKESK
jgi:hypothetical protein